MMNRLSVTIVVSGLIASSIKNYYRDGTKYIRSLTNRGKCCHEENSELDTSYDHKSIIFPHFKIHVPKNNCIANIKCTNVFVFINVITFSLHAFTRSSKDTTTYFHLFSILEILTF